LFVAKGEEVNVAHPTVTPLHDTVLLRNTEIVELLIANSADMSAHEMVVLLRKHGGKTGEELKAAGN